VRRLAAGALAGGLAAASALAQGPPGAVVTSLTLFAGTPSGLWKSGNWGGSWERVRPGPVHALWPVGPRVFAGADEGLLVSEDFGLSWSAVDLKAPVLAVMPSRFPLAEPVVFAGTPRGLLRSEDGGRTFSPTPITGTPVRRIAWPGPDLVLATGLGVLVSSDGARTFRTPVEGLPRKETRALVLSSFFAVDPVLFAGQQDGLHRSADGGRTWKPAGLEGRAVNDLVWLGPFLYAATDAGLFRSEDAGARWTALGKGLDGRQSRRLMFPMAPAAGLEAFLGTDRGVFRTVDGGESWKPSGLGEEEVLALATFPPPDPVQDGRR
jgi:photosystem II stability/assembly factor-like uncharacterized protein